MYQDMLENENNNDQQFNRPDCVYCRSIQARGSRQKLLSKIKSVKLLFIVFIDFKCYPRINCLIHGRCFICSNFKKLKNIYLKIKMTTFKTTSVCEFCRYNSYTQIVRIDKYMVHSVQTALTSKYQHFRHKTHNLLSPIICILNTLPLCTRQISQ